MWIPNKMVNMFKNLNKCIPILLQVYICDHVRFRFLLQIKCIGWYPNNSKSHIFIYELVLSTSWKRRPLRKGEWVKDPGVIPRDHISETMTFSFHFPISLLTRRLHHALQRWFWIAEMCDCPLLALLHWLLDSGSGNRLATSLVLRGPGSQTQAWPESLRGFLKMQSFCFSESRERLKNLNVLPISRCCWCCWCENHSSKGLLPWGSPSLTH